MKADISTVTGVSPNFWGIAHPDDNWAVAKQKEFNTVHFESE